MAVYMNYKGIDGEVTTSPYQKWIEIHSFQFGVGRSISMPMGGGVSKRESSNPSVSEITITKDTDSTSPKFMEQALVGKMDSDVKFAFVRTKTGGETEAYLEFTLSNCAVSGYSMSSGGDRPNESISINFTKVEQKYTAYDLKGSGTPTAVTYDLETRKKT
jgi:type VI secretion system secreted protein Hcp